MKTRLTALAAVLAFAGISALANEVTVSEAKAKASALIANNSRSRLRSVGAEPQLVYTADMTNDDTRASYYVFSKGAGKGFVVISGNDCARPVLGISDEGDFDYESLPDGLKSWFDGMREQVSQAAMEGATVAEQPSYSNSRQNVSPLLTSTWGQDGGLYNKYAPEISGNKALAGCVAIASAQICRYWGNQLSFKGSVDYTANDISISEDLSQFSIDYSTIPDVLNASSSEEAVENTSKLIYATGVAFRSSYGTDVTTAQQLYTPSRMFEHLGFSPTSTIYMRKYCGDETYNEVIYNEMTEGRPVLYWGGVLSDAHCFVIDGYDAEQDLFHCNFGWKGTCNGYYALTSIKPTGSPFNFSVAGYDGCVVGLRPDTGDRPVRPYHQLANLAYSSYNATYNEVTFTTILSALGVMHTTDYNNLGLKFVNRNNPEMVMYAYSIYGTKQVSTTVPTSRQPTKITVKAANVPNDGEDWLVSIISRPCTSNYEYYYAADEPCEVLVENGCVAEMVFNSDGSTFALKSPAAISVDEFSPNGTTFTTGKTFVATLDLSNKGEETYQGEIVLSLVNANTNEVVSSESANIEVVTEESVTIASTLRQIGTFVPVLTNADGSALNISKAAAETLAGMSLEVKAPIRTAIEDVTLPGGIKIDGRTISAEGGITLYSLKGEQLLTGNGTLTADELPTGIYVASTATGTSKVLLY